MYLNLTNGNDLNSHPWRFSRLGGFDQVQLNSGADLLNLPTLDQKLWAALSCPASGLQFDDRTLAFLDTDKDGRIRVPEVIAAVQWVTRVLKQADDLVDSRVELPLAAINEADSEGQRVLTCAREILQTLGKPHAGVITLADLQEMNRIFSITCFNGDGVIPPQASTDPVIQQVIADIMHCCGGTLDLCGAEGITQANSDHFFAEAALFAAWWQTGQQQLANDWPFQGTAETVAQTFLALESKIDDFFTRCQLAAYDPRAVESLNPALATYGPLAGQTISCQQAELTTLPLAQIQATLILPLRQGLNPSWAQAMANFREQIAAPLLGAVDSLSYTQWLDIKGKFVNYLAWQQQKQGVSVACLGIARVRELLAGNYQPLLNDLIAQDLALAPEVQAIEAVEKLLYYGRDLYRLLRNFVNFHDFYAPNPNSIFQVGTLYLDGRSCKLCVQVDDIAKHASMALQSRIFIAYCECQCSQSREKMTIAAAFTGGDADNLMLGRNGIFYDHDGQDWDATIVKIIEHPISVSQAFLDPYKRLINLISEQIEKFALAKDKNAQITALSQVTELEKAAATPKPPPTPFDVSKSVGIFAAIGLGIGAIGTAIASIVGGFLALPFWQMPLVILGVLLIISGPSMLIAYLKLHQRNLAPLLDASGWAVNAKAYINIPFGRSLTGTAKLPKNALRQLVDPFGEKKRPWRLYLGLVVMLCLLFGMAEHGYLTLLYHALVTAKP